MAKQVTNRVSTIKLLGGQYTQSRKKTGRINFPDSNVNNDPSAGQGQVADNAKLTARTGT
jgi:hypothetical protein